MNQQLGVEVSSIKVVKHGRRDHVFIHFTDQVFLEATLVKRVTLCEKGYETPILPLTNRAGGVEAKCF